MSGKRSTDRTGATLSKKSIEMRETDWSSLYEMAEELGYQNVTDLFRGIARGRIVLQRAPFEQIEGETGPSVAELLEIARGDGSHAVRELRQFQIKSDERRRSRGQG